MMERVVCWTVMAMGLAGYASAEGVLNVYNWSDYIAPDTIARFEAETGIDVNYDVFDSNEILEARMLTGGSGYDVVVPSIEFMARQIQAGVFAPVDREALPNYGNLDANILKVVATGDPGNVHGVPYMMFTTGLGYNVDLVRARIGADRIGSWDMVFDPATVAKLADCGVALLDSPTEIVAAALNYLGLDPNSENDGDLERATALLLSVRPHIRYFHSSQYINDLANGALCVAVGYSGDVLQARDRAAEAGRGVTIAYTIPAEGGQAGFDMLAVPVDAPNKENAWRFIDYILRPAVAADITNHVFFANPNAAATPLVAEAVRNDPGIYPPESVRAKLFSLKPRSARSNRILTRAWMQIKTGK